jgi:hypothetical protein
VSKTQNDTKVTNEEQLKSESENSEVKASRSKGKGLDMTWLVLGLLIGLAVITSVINYVSENKARQLIAEFEARNPVPRIVVMDFDGMIKEWKESGEPDDRIMRGVALISKMLREDNYIVLDYKAVVTSGKKFNLRAFSLDTIEEMAISRGMDLDEEVKELLKEAEAEAQKMMEELMKQMNAQSARGVPAQF